MKNIILVALGMITMFVILKVLSKKTESSDSEVKKYFFKLAETDEAVNLIKSKEFKAVVKTSEFKKLFSVLSDEYLSAFAKSII